MADAPVIGIEVAYATPERQKIVTLQLAKGSTARDAVLASGLDTDFPDLKLSACPIGVFGAAVADAHQIHAGDRVEIYRPLLNEPREARRAAAARGDTLGASKK